VGWQAARLRPVPCRGTAEIGGAQKMTVHLMTQWWLDVSPQHWQNNGQPHAVRCKLPGVSDRSGDMDETSAKISLLWLLLGVKPRFLHAAGIGVPGCEQDPHCITWGWSVALLLCVDPGWPRQRNNSVIKDACAWCGSLARLF
jgi:hypothetical protein